MKPVFVEVIAPVLTAYSHCQHCEVIFDRADVAAKKHQMDMDEYPEDVKRDYTRLCDWVAATAARYRGRIQIKITDPQSLEGVWKAIRYRVRKYPTVIINGKDKYVGWQEPVVEAALARLIPEPAAAPAGAH